jgi:drug/metabolite transporter (DMT)-like permease
MLGGMIALLAAASFAFNSATARRAVLSGTVFQGIAITVPMQTPMFFLGVLVFGQLDALWNMPLKPMLWLSIAGILHFVWGRYFIYRAQEMLGANLAGALQQFDMVISLVLAIVVLGEIMTPLRALGIVLVVLGPALAMTGERGRKPARVEAPTEVPAAAAPASVAKFTPRHVEGYIYTALSSIGYGLSPIFTSLALRELGTGAALAGGVVACVAATAVFALFVLATGLTGHILSANRETWKWFGLAGLSVGISQMLRFTALSLAPVSVVQPIQRLSKLFLFVFSWLMNREHEVFNPRLVVAAVVSLFGAVMLSVSTDVVLALAQWPDWLVTVVRWQWP